MTELNREDLLLLLRIFSEKYYGPFTLVDLMGKDQPLIAVNEIFLITAKRKREECEGQNCRFLQGEKTDKKTVESIKNGIKNRECFFVDILNYRGDRSEFWNRLALVPLPHDFYVGLQHDMSLAFMKGKLEISPLAQPDSISTVVKDSLSNIISQFEKRITGKDPINENEIISPFNFDLFLNLTNAFGRFSKHITEL